MFVVCACLALKSALILIDDRVRLFMGDSATYLGSAVSLQVPPDRSYTYPLFIRAIAMPFASISPLLWMQTLCGVATAAMVAWLLRNAFAARRCVAGCAAMLVSVDPLQLFYERMVMTESLSTCVLVAGLCVAVAYVRSGRLPLLALCVAFGVVSASLRVGMVPLACVLSIAAVLSRWEAARRKEFGKHLVIALALTCATHAAYRYAYGFATHGEAVYIRDGGLFRLGLAAPLVRAEDFDGTRIDADLLNEVTIPLADETTREAQIWSPGGLIDVLKRHAGAEAYPAASKIASHAMWRDPIGVVKLGIATTVDYFDPRLREMRLYSDLGFGQPPDERTITLLRDHFGYNASGLARTPSPMYRYFEANAWWPTACLFALAPLALVAAFGFARRNRAALLLALVACGLVAGEVLCSHIVSFRYLHPFTVMVLLQGVVIVDGLLRAAVRRRSQIRNEISPLEALAT